MKKFYYIDGQRHPDDYLNKSTIQHYLKGVAVVHSVLNLARSEFQIIVHKNKNFIGSEEQFEEILKKQLAHGYYLSYIKIHK